MLGYSKSVLYICIDILIKTQTKIQIKMGNAMKKKAIKVTRERAIQIAMNHNGISRGMAERYTDSELREVLRHLRLQAAF